MKPYLKVFNRVFLLFIHLPAKLAGKKYRQIYGKLKMCLNVFWHSYIPQIWSIQSFAYYLFSAVHKLFRIYFLRKLFPVSFPNKHIKFWADKFIYPECNAWHHLFGYRGLYNKSSYILSFAALCTI